MSTHTIHTHQHRLDRSHNILLLFIPGLIFTIVIGVYLILRLETGQTLQGGIAKEVSKSDKILDNISN